MHVIEKKENISDELYVGDFVGIDCLRKTLSKFHEIFDPLNVHK